VISKAVPLLSGAFLGVLLFVTPWLIAYAFFAANNAGMALAYIWHIVSVGLIGIAFIIQLVASVILCRKNCRNVAAGIWLCYPIAAVIATAVFIHNGVRTKIATVEDYSGRELDPPKYPVNRILLDLSDNSADGRQVNPQRCDVHCVAILNTGSLESIAITTPVEGGGYAVFRLKHGPDCNVAAENYKRYFAARRDYRIAKGRIHGAKQRLQTRPSTKKSLKDYQDELEQVQQSAKPDLQRYAVLAGKPKVANFGAAKILAEAGYFDRCITHEFQKEYDFDVRVNYGRNFQRPYGPCCNIAEIHENRRGKLERLGRWEGSGKDKARRNSFTFSDVAAKLTGKNNAGDVTRHLTLVKYPMESAEQEMARLAGLAERGAYFHSWEATAKWIRRILDLRRRTEKVGKAGFSTTTIRHLAQIAPSAESGNRKKFLARIKPFLDQQSYEKLISIGSP